MLLVTFHGGTGGINNVYAYNTTDKTLMTDTALAAHPGVTLSELRSMMMFQGNLYVANGAKDTSNLLCYGTPASGPSFPYLSTVVTATFSKKKGHFKTSIAHPFGIAFDGGANCYVSNQDTNVVALVTLSPDKQSGSLGTGCRSGYLTQLYPPPDVFLDGTFVASQVGDLHDVKITATDVSRSHGGLAVEKDSSGKTHNSVRGVAVANGILFVCDEPDSAVNLYQLSDGAFLGSGPVGSDKPTHLVIYDGGLWVSAESSSIGVKFPPRPRKPRWLWRKFHSLRPGKTRKTRSAASPSMPPLRPPTCPFRTEPAKPARAPS